MNLEDLKDSLHALSYSLDIISVGEQPVIGGVEWFLIDRQMSKVKSEIGRARTQLAMEGYACSSPTDATGNTLSISSSTNSTSS